MEGKVLGWNRTSQEVSVLTDGKIITIPGEEFTTYIGEMDLTSSGIPKEVFHLEGMKINFTKLDNVYSRRIVMLQDFLELHEAQIVEAKVSGFSYLGNVFFKYRSLTFICNIREISSSFLRDPREYLKKGQEVRVKVVKKELSKYTEVSYKQAFQDSLLNYHQGDIITAKISSLCQDIGAYFIEITPPIRGIMDVEERCSNLPYGTIVKCYVKKVTPNGVRVGFLDIVD